MRRSYHQMPDSLTRTAKETGLTAYEIALYAAVSSRDSGTGWNISVPELAAESGMKPTRARVAIRTLVSMGLLTVHERGENGKQLPSHYRVVREVAPRHTDRVALRETDQVVRETDQVVRHTDHPPSPRDDVRKTPLGKTPEGRLPKGDTVNRGGEERRPRVTATVSQESLFRDQTYLSAVVEGVGYDQIEDWVDERVGELHQSADLLGDATEALDTLLGPLLYENTIACQNGTLSEDIVRRAGVYSWLSKNAQTWLRYTERRSVEGPPTPFLVHTQEENWTTESDVPRTIPVVYGDNDIF